MKSLVMAVLLVSTATAQSTYKVQYDGGTLTLKPHTSLKLIVDGNRIQFTETDSIDARDVASLRYTSESSKTFIPSIPLGGFGGPILATGASIGMRGLSTIAKQPNRYLSISWDHGSIVLKLGSDWRAVVAELESATGKSANVTR